MAGVRALEGPSDGLSMTWLCGSGGAWRTPLATGLISSSQWLSVLGRESPLCLGSCCETVVLCPRKASKSEVGI